MLKRLIVLLLEFGAGLAGNLLAGYIQQDRWLDLFTPSRLVGTAVGAELMIPFAAVHEIQGIFGAAIGRPCFGGFAALCRLLAGQPLPTGVGSWVGHWTYHRS